MWTRDFAEFKKEDAMFGSFFEFEDSEAPPTTTLAPPARLRPYYRKLAKFLDSVYYQFYRSFLKVDYSQ